MLDIASGTLCTHSQLKTAAPPYKVPTGQYGSGSGNGSQRNTVKDPPLPDGHWLLHASNPQIIIQVTAANGIQLKIRPCQTVIGYYMRPIRKLSYSLYGARLVGVLRPNHSKEIVYRRILSPHSPLSLVFAAP
ncbi:hypothetical protein QE152_g11337 [Popillia japonica]|uniref:Uncharacterized protein n=1 Tax=Popillia japonica TaxID=7064 RepID=A0AAW1LTM3_POPJA